METAKQKVIITFRRTVDAMNMEKECAENHIPGRIIPVPTRISAGCGMCWSADINHEMKIMSFVEERGIAFEGVHHIDLKI